MTLPSFARSLAVALLAVLAFSASPAHAVAPKSPEKALVAQEAFDAGVSQVTGADGLPRLVRWEVTRQGFAELIEMESQLVAKGLISPRGWVLDCPGLAAHVRQWLDSTTTLTGVYLAASWLEHWGVECRPRQQVAWTRSDLRRMRRAVARARSHWPEAWPEMAPAYEDRAVRVYLKAINAHGGLNVVNRPCARMVSKAVRKGRLALTQAAHRAKQCPPSLTHGALVSSLDPDRFEGVPLSASLATSFLALDRWVLPPDVLVRLLRTPEALQKLLVEMAIPIPAPSVLPQRAGWLKHPDALAQPASAPARDYAARVAPVFSQWPTPAVCQGAGQAVRSRLVQAQSFASAYEALAVWPVVGVMCPDQAPSLPDAELVDGTLARLARSLPASPAFQALGAPLFEDYLRQIHSLHPSTRQACFQRVLDEVQAQPDSLPQGLRRARAVCPVAYQGRFPQSVGGQP